MIKILLADDENLELRYLNSVFSQDAVKDRFKIVGSAKNGSEAVRMAKLYNPHVLITDIKMPVLDGIEAANIIRKINPRTVVILNTAYAEFEFAKKALEHRFDAYLLKPADASEIISTIDKCMEKNQFSVQESQKEPISGNIEKAKEYIKDNLESKITLDDVSEYVHFSPTYFSKLFKEEEGITLSQYINRERVKKAKILLVQSNMNIKDICTRCGFSSISNFNREFKQQTGMTPSEMRKE